MIVSSWNSVRMPGSKKVSVVFTTAGIVDAMACCRRYVDVVNPLLRPSSVL